MTVASNTDKSRRRIVLFDSNVGYIGTPLGLLSITSLLSPEEYEIHIITKREYPNYENTILALCQNSLCLGISCITGPPIQVALTVSARVKARYPGLPIIWGGWQPMTLPDLTLQNPAIDYLCTGQGERTFSEFVTHLKTGDEESLRGVAGLSYKIGNRLIHNPPAEPEDINNFPDYALDLIQWEKHVEASEYGKGVIRLSTSFGCPYRCAFCSEQEHCRRNWKALTPERVVTFLKKLRAKVELDCIGLVDNNFFVSEKRVIGICEGLLSNGFDIQICGLSARANELVRYKPATWELLRKAGLRSVQIGVESANQATLDFIRKDVTIEQVLELCRICARYDVKPCLSFMMGMPIDAYFTDPASAFDGEFSEIYAFFKRVYFEITRNFLFFVFFYTPFPMTPLYARSIDKGFVPPRTLEGWAKYRFYEIQLPWILKAQAYSPRMKMLQYISTVMGTDYANHVRHTPHLFRWVGLTIVKLGRFVASQRLKHDAFGFPIDRLVFTWAEKAFRALNELIRISNLSDGGAGLKES